MGTIEGDWRAKRRAGEASAALPQIALVQPHVTHCDLYATTDAQIRWPIDGEARVQMFFDLNPKADRTAR